MLRLPGYLQRNGYRNPDNGKTSPFADTYGMHSWDYFRTVAEKGRIFNSFMTMVREWAKKLYEIYPVESLLECLHSGTSDSPWLVVDVGGGQGHVMQQLVAEFPQFKGHLIVQDLPATVGDADKLAADGIKAMKYDFTTPQPIKSKPHSDNLSPSLPRSLLNCFALSKTPKCTIYAKSSTTGPTKTASPSCGISSRRCRKATPRS